MSRKDERGMTILEVMVAGVILLVAMLGFAATAGSAATATGVAHRRSVASYFRSGLLERYAVTARSTIQSIPTGTWVVDGCYGMNSEEKARNTGFSTTFTCSSDSYYRSWVHVTGAAGGPWQVSTYAERIDPGCSATDRYSSLACVAADLFLTD